MSDERDRKLFIPCAGKDKGDWIKAANARKMKLEDWVNATLNEAARRADLPAPSWMDFSQRTTDALMRARIYKETELIERIEEDTLFNIENFGPRCVAEVKAWYQDKRNRD